MKTRNNVYFLLLLLCVFPACEKDKNADFFLETVFIENDERLLNYDAVKTTDREPFFIEEFDDNISLFPYQIGIYEDREVSITDGKMTVKFSKNNDYIFSTPAPLEIDESRNFEMEICLIVYRSYSEKHTFAWLPNLSTNSGYAINYWQGEDSESTTIETIRVRKDDWKEDKKGYDFNAKDFLNTNEFTILTVRKIKDKYAIFINHKLFYIINDKNFNYTPTITMVDNVSNVFDYFRVYYLP